MNDAPSPDAPRTADLPAPAVPARSSGGAWRNPWLYVALAGIGLAGWQWAETRSRLADTQQEMARRLAAVEAQVRDGSGAAKQAESQVAALQGKLAALEARQAEFQGQTEALQNLYQDLSRSRDEATLLDIEQAVTLAAQQLQLAGNVQAAVLALQTADARLSRLDRPQFIPLRKTLARDLERLRALPFVDLPGMSFRLESVVLAVDKLPLAIDQRPRPEATPAAAAGAEAPWWEKAGQGLWQEIRNLVRIQRFDRNEPVLLAPGQAFFLRENVKLRLLNARLALLSRDGATFRAELRAAQDWLERHFDARDKTVQGAVASLKQLGAADIAIELPSLNDSLAAVRNFKAPREKK